MSLWIADLGIEQPTRTILTNTTTTTILGASTKGPQPVAKVHVCNIDSGAVTVDIEVYNGTISHYLEKARSVAPGASFDLYDELLQSGESLRATSGNASGKLHISVLSALATRGS